MEIPIATNINQQLHDPTPPSELHAIYVQPYGSTFQAVYIIDIDQQQPDIESQQQSIEYHPQTLTTPQQMQLKKYTNICVKVIGPLVLAILIIIGTYYNSTVH